MREVKIKKYKGSVILRIAIISLCLFVIGTLVTQQIKINEMNNELDDYLQEIELQQIVNDEIRESIDDSINSKEEFAEDYARSEYDYAMQDETVFVNIGGN